MKENVNMMVLEVKAKSETYFQVLEKDLNHFILVHIYREYFKEVSIETKTIVETIENAQGIDF